MPKGRPRQQRAQEQADVARAELVTQMFEALSGYAVDCARTAGALGAMKPDGTPGHLTAATKVMDFVAAHAGTERDEALDGLLKAVADIRSHALEKVALEDEPGNTESGG